MSEEMTTMLAGVIEQAKEIAELKATTAALSAALEQAKAECEGYKAAAVKAKLYFEPIPGSSLWRGLVFCGSCEQSNFDRETKTYKGTIDHAENCVCSDAFAARALDEWRAMQWVCDAAREMCESNLCKPNCQCQVGPALDGLDALRGNGRKEG